MLAAGDFAYQNSDRTLGHVTDLSDETRKLGEYSNLINRIPNLIEKRTFSFEI